MKQIFKTLTPFILLFLIAFNSYSQTPKQKLQKVKVLFTSKMTKDDLEKIKSTLLEKSIQLELVQTEFDKNGHLTSLKFKVDCKDGFKGEASNADFNKNKRFGFFRDYSKKAKSPFGVGFI
jgi:hypothetical protein